MIKKTISQTQIRWFLPLAFLSLLNLTPVQGEIRQQGYSAGIRTSGPSLQWDPFSQVSFGAHIQGAGGVSAYGLRQIYYFNPQDTRWNFFIGLEENRVFFDIDDVKGKGWTAGIFLGGDYFLSKRWSLQMDVGPSYISLEDNEASVANEGLEFVANFGIHWHWGGK